MRSIGRRAGDASGTDAPNVVITNYVAYLSVSLTNSITRNASARTPIFWAARGKIQRIPQVSGIKDGIADGNAIGRLSQENAFATGAISAEIARYEIEIASGSIGDSALITVKKAVVDKGR